MSANLLQKAFALFSIGTSLIFITTMYFRSPKTQKHNAFKIRQQLIKRNDTKLLYSTMSFLYLHGFESQSIDSFFILHKILTIQQPNLVALPISKQDYQNKYLKAMKHPKYRQSMDKLKYYLKNEERQNIKNMQYFDLKNLQKLYLIDHCLHLKKCKIICCRRNIQQYKNIQKIYYNINQNANTQHLYINDMKCQDYAQKIVQEMNPKMKFSFLPQSPYKTVVGIIQPELLSDTAQRWKKKFKQNYQHQVIEDEQVLEREKTMRLAQNKEV